MCVCARGRKRERERKREKEKEKEKKKVSNEIMVLELYFSGRIATRKKN